MFRGGQEIDSAFHGGQEIDSAFVAGSEVYTQRAAGDLYIVGVGNANPSTTPFATGFTTDAEGSGSSVGSISPSSSPYGAFERVITFNQRDGPGGDAPSGFLKIWITYSTSREPSIGDVGSAIIETPLGPNESEEMVPYFAGIVTHNERGKSLMFHVPIAWSGGIDRGIWSLSVGSNKNLSILWT
jgi:hypothetical protein